MELTDNKKVRDRGVGRRSERKVRADHAGPREERQSVSTLFYLDLLEGVGGCGMGQEEERWW